MSARRIRGSWWCDFRYECIRFRKKSPDNTKAGAESYERTLRGRLARGETAEAKQAEPTFRQFAEHWLATYVATNNKHSEQQAKAGALKRHLLPAFGDLKLSAITTKLVEVFKCEKTAEGLCAKSVNNQLAILRKCLNTAHDWEHLAAVPPIRPLRAAVPAFDFLTDPECEQLLACTTGMVHTMILTALRTGMRMGELCALEWSSVDLTNRRITVAKNIVRGVVGTPKSGKLRHIPIMPDLACELSAHRTDTTLVFPADHGGHLSDCRAGRLLGYACKRAGLRHFGWHTLRHTFASQLAARSVPLRSVQALLGHSTIQMTERYAHLMPSALDDAMATLATPSVQASWATGGQRSVESTPFPTKTRTLTPAVSLL